jgi:aromatic ring-opening dioxygenase catalytic subunit (LigB family)
VDAGFSEPTIDKKRGFDHGIFVPLLLMYPEADIPVTAISLVIKNKVFDPLYHFNLGLAVGPLREEGVLVLGSGFSYHNMQGYGTPEGKSDSHVFDAYLQDMLTNKAYTIA